MTKKVIWAIVVSAFLMPLVALAYSNPGKPTGFVNDYAGLMSAATRQSLETELSNFEKETRHEIAVVTIPNLGGDTIENFAVKLFADWQIGKKGADNGVLFLISKDDRQMRIEVGYGLEGALTDAQSFAIIDEIAKPAFQAGDYDAGIKQAVTTIEAAVRGEDVSGLIPVAARTKKGPSPDAIFFGLIFVLFILRIFANVFSRSKAWWPGGIWGAMIGLVAGLFIFGFIWKIIFVGLGLGALGLILDYIVSKHGPFDRRGPGPGGFFLFGGGGSGGGGGFGGFGGGRSGGGGASGNW